MENSVNATTVKAGDRVRYLDIESTVDTVTVRRPGPKGGHFTTVTFTDGRRVDLKPGHAMPRA